MLFLNPLIWLHRIRHRRGYGVHSPFAFNFLTYVVYERGIYYAYQRLDALYPRWHRLLGTRPLQRSRLFFRLANYAHPARAVVVGGTAADVSYMHEACKNAHFIDAGSDETADFIYLAVPDTRVLDSHVHPGAMLVLDNLRRHRTWWRMLQQDARTRVTFDLYDVGIAFFDPKLNKQNYIVNF